MTPRFTRRRSAFSLYEMIVALALLVVVLDAAGKLFRSVVLVSADAQRTTGDASQVDSAISQMRRDVWNADQIALSDPRSIALSAGGHATAFWQLGADGSVLRTDFAGKIEKWPAIGADWNFTSDGSALTVSDKSSNGLFAVHLVSQVLASKDSE